MHALCSVWLLAEKGHTEPQSASHHHTGKGGSPQVLKCSQSSRICHDTLFKHGQLMCMRVSLQASIFCSSGA